MCLKLIYEGLLKSRAHQPGDVGSVGLDVVHVIFRDSWEGSQGGAADLP